MGHAECPHALQAARTKGISYLRSIYGVWCTLSRDRPSVRPGPRASYTRTYIGRCLDLPWQHFVEAALLRLPQPLGPLNKSKQRFRRWKIIGQQRLDDRFPNIKTPVTEPCARAIGDGTKSMRSWEGSIQQAQERCGRSVFARVCVTFCHRQQQRNKRTTTLKCACGI